MCVYMCVWRGDKGGGGQAELRLVSGGPAVSVEGRSAVC